MYKKLYFTLFGRVEDALELLDDGNVWEAREKLLDTVTEAENTYIKADEEPTEAVVLAELLAQVRKAVGRLEQSERQSLRRLLEQEREGN